MIEKFNSVSPIRLNLQSYRVLSENTIILLYILRTEPFCYNKDYFMEKTCWKMFDEILPSPKPIHDVIRLETRDKTWSKIKQVSKVVII